MVYDTSKAKFYDFEVNETGIPSLITWDAQMVRTDNEKGKATFIWSSIGNEAIHNFNNSEEMIETVMQLRKDDYVSIQEMEARSFDVKVKNPASALRLKLLAARHQLLGKFYDDKAINEEGLNCVVRYIYYVDVLTGKIIVRNIQTDNYNPQTIAELNAEGYKPIEGSFLFSRISELSGNNIWVVEGSFPQGLQVQ